MNYTQVWQLEDAAFRRLTGVKRPVFEKMVAILRLAQKSKSRRGGRARKLDTPELLLMTLQYLRQYNTYFEIAQSYGLSESNAYKTIKWVEDTLIKDPLFALPSKRALVREDSAYETILIDATETGDCDRASKKNSAATTRARKRSTRSKAKSSLINAAVELFALRLVGAVNTTSNCSSSQRRSFTKASQPLWIRGIWASRHITARVSYQRREVSCTH